LIARAFEVNRDVRRTNVTPDPYTPPKAAAQNTVADRRGFGVRYPLTGVPFAVYCVWQWTHMTENTSFEHHPLSGALILIHESQTVPQLFVCTAICISLVCGIFAVVIRPNLLTTLMSGITLFAWFYLSYTLAVWAVV